MRYSLDLPKCGDRFVEITMGKIPKYGETFTVIDIAFSIRDGVAYVLLNGNYGTLYQSPLNEFMISLLNREIVRA